MKECIQCDELILNASTGKYDGEVDVHYYCAVCSRSYSEDEVVILTKARHQELAKESVSV